MAPSAAAVRATVERGAHDSIELEHIGGLVRELLTQAWYAAECPPVELARLQSLSKPNGGPMIDTEYGQVEVSAHGTSVSGTRDEFYSWAHRPGAWWPCSELARLERLTVSFDARGDLVDLDPLEVDITSDELSAWSSDVLRAAGFDNHPAIR